MCPNCGSPKSSIERTRAVDVGAHVKRTRMCDLGHRYDTVERHATDSIDSVLVRSSATQQLIRPFDRVWLLHMVRESVLKTKRWPEGLDVKAPVERSIEELEMRLPRISHPLSRSEQAARPRFRTAILDADISRTLESHLRRGEFRLAHVLYVLSTEGRTDLPHRNGFRGAWDLLEWMHRPENYADLRTSDLVEAGSAPSDRWWPSGHPPRPERVIKRDLRSKPEFGYGQFLRSIERALHGRGLPRDTGRCVAAWVMWGLAGQRDVLTSQLATGVLDALRRVDDIAYLKWASTAKNFDSVRELHREAASLATAPSRRLVFDVDAKPRRPVSH